jgi:hypothetical protein
MRKIRIIFGAFLALTLVVCLTNCNKEAKGEDKILFDKSVVTSGFSYYKGSNAILASSNPSAHNPYFRMRYNAIAIAAMTDNGKLPVGGSFPDGSVVVKELYDSPTGALKLLAVMEKSSSNSLAGEGWLWGEYEPDGKVFYSIDKKGIGCTGCHSTNAIDYNRVFNLFP